MTMALRFRHLPPELESAKRTLDASLRDALPTSEKRRRQIVSLLALFGVGALAGGLLVSLGLVTAADRDFWRSGLMVVSVLCGFMVATMVFTGRIETAKSLSITELREVTSKSNYLLLYQIATMANHVVCLAVMMLVVPVGEATAVGGVVVALLGLAFLFVSLLRSLLIPVQIIELHRFTHAALLREKAEEAERDAQDL